MEVGCGPGRMLPLYAGVPEVHCVDFSERMLRRAQARAQKAGWDHVRFSQMAAQDLDFPYQHCDASPPMSTSSPTTTANSSNKPARA